MYCMRSCTTQTGKCKDHVNFASIDTLVGNSLPSFALQCDTDSIVITSYDLEASMGGMLLMEDVSSCIAMSIAIPTSISHEQPYWDNFAPCLEAIAHLRKDGSTAMLER